MPTVHTERNRVRTGYERVIAHKVGRSFAGIAEQDGRVTNIDKKAHLVEVTYADGTVDEFKYGEEYLELQGFHTSNNIIPLVSPGQTVSKGDVITYNKGFFNVDPMTKQLDFSIGTMANTAIMEIDTTLEDSTEISENFSKKMGMTPVNSRVVVLDKRSMIHYGVKIGSVVKHSDPLFIFEEEPMEGSGMFNADAETLALLGDLNRSTPSAKFSGQVVKIEAYYGCPISEMHPTLQDIVRPAVEEKNRRNKMASKSIRSDDFAASGIMPKGSKFKGVMFDENTVCLIVYIKEHISADTGDKVVLCNQLKCTIGSLFDKPIFSESGVEIDMLFSSTNIYRRQCLSPVFHGLIARNMEKLEEDVVNMYFNEKE